MNAPVERSRWGDLKRLVGETGSRYVGLYALAFVLLGVVSATTAATAWLMKDVINEVFIAKSRDALFFVAGAVFVIYVARGLAAYGQGVILARIGNAIVAEGQKRLVAALLSQPLPVVLSRTSSEVVQKQVLSAESARQVLQVLVTVVGRDVLTLIGLIAVMVVQDPLVSGFVLLVLPVAAIFVAGLGMRIRKVQKRQVSIGVTLADQLRQIIQGIRVVKAFGAEDRLGTRLAGVIEEQQKNADRAAVLMSRTQPIVETLAGIAVALVILYGGWRVIGHGATPGEFFSFITALLLAYDPARRLASARLQVEQHLVGLGLFYEMIDEAVPANTARGDTYDPKGGAIRFEKASFGYENDTPLLDSLDLDFPAGKVTALVGPSGSGKSTMLSLILGFWPLNSGRISVDGQDLAALDPASLREKIAYVGQDAFLFDGSIRENIAIGAANAQEAAIIAAAKAAHAHDFITALPQGYDTPVGELAGRLSGGQRSRIAIARAFLRDAPILLLDEPTAALDAASEEAIRTTLAELAAGRTTILVAHRLASVTGADRIVVLDRGLVAESGDHATLMARNGVYAGLFRLQNGGNAS
ncbi:MAG: ABC transporter ATP-binding protein/permease [Proteobacteria bacterium]|nr:ABC transporter ATP-binding protein/permease [Pseudomonadota bacterium]